MRYLFAIFCIFAPLYSNIAYNFGFEYGVFSVKDYTFNVIRYTPQISTENFLASINFDFIYDTNGNFYFNKYTTIESIFSKIAKIQYTNDFFFLEIEKKLELQLTDGILMKRFYINHLSPLYYYPSGRAFLNLDFLNLIIITDNILDFDIFASSFKIYPLFFTKQENLKDIFINFETLIDLDPENTKKINIKNEPIKFNDISSNYVFNYKFGLTSPIYKNNFLNFSLNIDYAGIYTKGIGFFGGIMGEFWNLFNLSLTYGFCGEKFVPHYVDVFYENEKNFKFNSLDNINVSYNYYSIASGLTFFDKNLKLEIEFEKQERENKNPELYLSITFDKKFFKIIDLRFSFHKADIKRIEDLTLSSDFSRMSLNFNFYMSENIIFGFEYKYLFHPIEIINYKNDIFMYIKANF
ncbi:MAG: hypothetical protein N2258_05475 [Brevinematales bacterium]|nr:hypothetical protein [Brevinematales bacterium]